MPFEGVFMRRSLGKMSKRTRLLGHSGRKLTPTMIMRTFRKGQLVLIAPQSRYEGMPHPRYRGKVGTIREIRGRAYVVLIQDYNMQKPLVVPGVHLRPKDKSEETGASQARNKAEAAKPKAKGKQ
jgi:large subunit ribosomal protein L21e